MTPPKVFFFTVKETPAKLHAIVSIAHHCFTSGAPLLFTVATAEAARYLDELLWKFPAESFLPHAILSRPSKELIAITTLAENLNQAIVLFNLAPEVSPLTASMGTIYDFLDHTHPTKLEHSLKRKELYLQQGCVIEAL